jgi:hypothetical protein
MFLDILALQSKTKDPEDVPRPYYIRKCKTEKNPSLFNDKHRNQLRRLPDFYK